MRKWSLAEVIARESILPEEIDWNVSRFHFLPEVKSGLHLSLAARSGVSAGIFSNDRGSQLLKGASAKAGSITYSRTQLKGETLAVIMQLIAVG